jgi:hypothetical protein
MQWPSSFWKKVIVPTFLSTLFKSRKFWGTDCREIFFSDTELQIMMFAVSARRRGHLWKLWKLWEKARAATRLSRLRLTPIRSESGLCNSAATLYSVSCSMMFAGEGAILWKLWEKARGFSRLTSLTHFRIRNSATDNYDLSEARYSSFRKKEIFRVSR